MADAPDTGWIAAAVAAGVAGIRELMHYRRKSPTLARITKERDECEERYAMMKDENRDLATRTTKLENRVEVLEQILDYERRVE